MLAPSRHDLDAVAQQVAAASLPLISFWVALGNAQSAL